MNALLLSACWAFGQVGELPVEFTHDFRGRPLPSELQLMGDSSGRMVKSEPEGWRIVIPPDYKHPFGGVGFRTGFGLKGDFEVTATFEILHADVPTKGFGSGVTLRVQKADSQAAVSICRLVRAEGKQLVYSDRAIDPPDKKGQPRFDGLGAPWTENVGRLRLKREGAILYCFYAAGTEGEEFKQLRKTDFGAENISHIRVSGVTAGQPCKLDARIIKFVVRSGTLPLAAPKLPIAAAPRSAQPPQQTNRLWWLFGGLAALAIVAALLILLRRRRPAAVDVAGEGRPLSVQCPHCQKRLKLPARAVGKKTKCPDCATSFVAHAAPKDERA